MSSLPQSIPPQTAFLGKADADGNVTIDMAWYLLLYNVISQVLDTANGSVTVTPFDLSLLDSQGITDPTEAELALPGQIENDALGADIAQLRQLEQIVDRYDITSSDIVQLSSTMQSVQSLIADTNEYIPPINNVGEYVESVVANVGGFTTGEYQDATTISLTAGDWDVSGGWVFVGLSATTDIIGGLSIGTAGNAFTDLVQGSNCAESSAVNPTVASLAIASWRLLLSGTTTVRFKARVTFLGGTPSVYGRISARRVR